MNPFWIPIIFLLGWLGGLAVNYLADVLPGQRRLGQLVCPACKAPLRWQNWLVWPRRCSECGQRNLARTWLVDAAMTGLSLLLWFRPHPELPFLASWLLLVYFGVVVVIDIEHHLILNQTSIVGAFLAGTAGLIMHGWQATLLGGIGGYALMWALYWFGIIFMRIMARLRGRILGPGEDEALGYGDVTLSGILGLLLGWPGILLGLLLAIFLAAGASLALMASMLVRRRYQLFAAIPYGPFLVLGAVILVFFKDVVQGMF